MRVLIVEDEVLARQDLAETSRAEGYRRGDRKPVKKNAAF
jgi:hypothetical protein